MKSRHTSAVAAASALLLGPLAPAPAMAQNVGQNAGLTQKLNAYIGCINRLSERSYQSRDRYFSWASKKGPTGRERIIYGTYTIYDTTDCRTKVEKANAIEPHNRELEDSAAAYVEAVTTLEPLLKEADTYYDQQDYKDDKMAKGKALHPKLVAAWTAFASADERLRAAVEVLQDQQAVERLAEVEKTEGRKARWHIESLMMQAKQVFRSQSGSKPNLAQFTKAIGEFEAIVKATEAYAGENPKDRIGSMFISNAKTFLGSAKRLMRRVRDKEPYSAGDRMMLNTGSGAWMVEGSPARVTRDYNQLIGSYNSGARF